MKNILILLFSLTLVISCKKEVSTSTEYATFSGKIANTANNTLSIANQRYKKDIAISEDGSFSDTLRVEEGFYVLQNGEENSIIHLKNGYNLAAEFDVSNIKNSISFSGLGAGTNNYMADKIRLQESDDFKDFNNLFVLEKPQFDAKVAALKTKTSELLSNAQDLDSTVLENEKVSNQRLFQFLEGSYKDKHEVLITLAKGKPSPKFNYPDINGKKVSLDDLKGKYVYIDVWATWCGPCKVQIPYLKEIEENYKDKNIAFVGLSIDTQENKDRWKTMVGERGLGGYQVLADKDWKSKFVEDYKITGIPRFILIDPEGNIVSADAPRPSEPALLDLFNELKI